MMATSLWMRACSVDYCILKRSEGVMTFERTCHCSKSDGHQDTSQKTVLEQRGGAIGEWPRRPVNANIPLNANKQRPLGLLLACVDAACQHVTDG